MTETGLKSTDDLIRMLQEQHSLVQRLEKLAAEQSELIEAGKTEALLAVLGRRQEVIDQFVSSQSDMTALLERCRSDQGDLSENSRQQIELLVENINNQLAQIMKRDSLDQQRLESNRDRTRQDLTGVKTAKKAHQAYFKSHLVMNRFADRQG